MRLGKQYPLLDGNPTDTYRVYPCCCNVRYGLSGNMAEDCSYRDSVNYTLVREFVRDREASEGKIKWRKDFICGSHYPLPDGNPSEGDPDRASPHKWCGITAEHCSCSGCVDYSHRAVCGLIKSEEKCVLTAVGGIVKNVCFDETGEQIHNWKCANSNVSSACTHYPHGYQACGLFNTEIPSKLCGAFFCYQRYIKCGKDCKIDFSASPNSKDSPTRCDDKCDGYGNTCEDESDCYGYKYGYNCGNKNHLSVFKICDGCCDCNDGEDEKICSDVQITFTRSDPKKRQIYNTANTATKCKLLLVLVINRIMLVIALLPRKLLGLLGYVII